jgi:putative addiction module component (TIGR02574 family)
MARTLTKDEISKLPTGERLDLIAELWDSLSPSEVPVPESHRRALDEALGDYQHDPNAGQPWNEVKKDLRRKK